MVGLTRSTILRGNIMAFYKNKHVIIAMLVAPVLALISYFSVDALVAEKPHAAQVGEHYSLLEKSNCRYSSGACNLKNGDVELIIKPEWITNQRLRLTINSSMPLNNVIGARVNALGEEVAANTMKSTDSEGFSWSTEMITPDADLERLHVAVAINETWYYADAALKFINYEVAFDDDFRQ
jgi:hypothetical protein